MKISLDMIRVSQRIRQDVRSIDEMIADIRKNGLINPITVMPSDDGRYQLLAGLRRLRAAERMGWADIECGIVTPADAVAALNIEFSENEQRKNFTPEERVRYGLMMETAIKAAAKERKLMGKKNKNEPGRGCFDGDSDHVGCSPHGKTRDIVGAKIGMDGRTYEKAKYVFGSTDDALIDQVNKKEKGVSAAYNELRAKEKASEAPPAPVTESLAPPEATSSAPVAAEQPAPPVPPGKTAAPERKPRTKEDRIRRLEERVAQLEAELDTARFEANSAKADLRNVDSRFHNDIYHRQVTIDAQNRWIEKLEQALRDAGIPFPERLEKIPDRKAAI